MIQRRWLCVSLIAVLAPAIAVAGQLGQLQDAGGLSKLAGISKDLNGGGLLGSLGSGAFKFGSPENVAGVMAYCHAHGYLPSATATLKDKLLGKLGVQQKPAQSEGYKQGAAGLLQSADGHSFNLSTLKSSVGKQVCKLVANKATSSVLGK